MADLPRWIRTDRVDSVAMYSAYKDTVRETDPWFGKLTMRIHAGEGQVRPVRRVTVIPCVRVDCYLCNAKLGGYTFRWYHKSWRDRYLQYATKADLWMIEDPEKDDPEYANIIGD